MPRLFQRKQKAASSKKEEYRALVGREDEEEGVFDVGKDSDEELVDGDSDSDEADAADGYEMLERGRQRDKRDSM